MIIYSKSRVTFQNISLSREKEESFLVGGGKGRCKYRKRFCFFMKGLDFSWPAAFTNPKSLSMCGLREAERKPFTSRMLITVSLFVWVNEHSYKFLLAFFRFPSLKVELNTQAIKYLFNSS